MKTKHKHVWVKICARPQTVQRMSFLWPFFKQGIPEHNIKLNNFLVFPSEKSKKVYDNYLYEDEWKECLEKLANYLLETSVQEQEQEYKEKSENYKKAGEKVSHVDLKKWSNKELINWFKEYSKTYAKVSLYAFTPWAIDFVLAPRLVDKLYKINPKKSESWFEIISTPTKYNHLMEEQIDLFKIAISKDQKKLKEHTEKYYWIPIYNLGDKPWTIKDFKEMLKEIKDPEKQLKQKQEELINRKKSYANVLKEINPDEELKRLIDVTHFYTSLRDERVDMWRQVLYLIGPFYKEIARRAKILPEDAVSFLDEELIEFLEKGTLPKNLLERKKMHAVFFENGETIILTDEKDIRNLVNDKIEKQQEHEGKEIKGIGAYKGIVKGYARVLDSPNDCNLLKDREILVTHHTTPDYITAMKRAAAFVTDEGGITSHAAIISRELKIPCITATHVGSNVIKTGDLIEVNADKGIVKIK